MRLSDPFAPGSGPSSAISATECIDGTLLITLPSGRKLAYPEARLGPGKFNSSTQVYFKDNAKGGWKEIRGWHGTWCENVIQAISRDLLAGAMARLEAAGYPVVLHCHDEAVAEVPEGFGSTDEFLRLMTELPAWAKDLPIAAKVWTRQRYAKSELNPAPTASPEIPETAEPKSASSPEQGEPAPSSEIPETPVDAGPNRQRASMPGTATSGWCRCATWSPDRSSPARSSVRSTTITRRPATSTTITFTASPAARTATRSTG